MMPGANLDEPRRKCAIPRSRERLGTWLVERARCCAHTRSQHPRSTKRDGPAPFHQARRCALDRPARRLKVDDDGNPRRARGRAGFGGRRRPADLHFWPIRSPPKFEIAKDPFK
jgi:hypothetical protein